MIENNVDEVSNRDMTGFDVSYSGMTVTVSSGEYSIFNRGEVKTITSPEEVSFDIVPDNELDVVYDLYLIDNQDEPLHLERTEMSQGTIPIYTGDEGMLVCVMTVMIAPNTTDLDNATIISNKVVKIDEDNPSPEQPSQPDGEE